MVRLAVLPNRRLVLGGVLGAIAVFLAACNRESPPAVAKSTAVAAVAAPAPAPAAPVDPMTVTADADLAKRLQIQAVSTTSVSSTIRIAGRLDVNQYKTSRIGAPITGRITQIDALFGQQVRQGQTLAELNSPELAQAQLNFLRAHSQQQLLTRAVERAQLLLQADVIGSAELQRRQNELVVASAEKRAASDQLRALGLSASRLQSLETTGQIQQTTAITATLSGVVIDRKVALGQVVNPSDVLFLISDLSTLWALSEVPEQDAQFVKLGQRVEVEVPALDHKRIAGKVQFVADVVTPETRTVRVGVELANPDRALKPSMLITTLVEGRVSAQQVVPVAAIVRDNDRDHVFIETGPNAFRLVAVEAGLERDGKRPLARPLPQDARVVAEGAFHLNNVRVQRGLDGK